MRIVVRRDFGSSIETLTTNGKVMLAIHNPFALSNVEGQSNDYSTI
jgi:hypothetical protein